MLEVAAAQAAVLSHAKRLRPEVTAVMSAALGQVLAADVVADLDSPAFDKALMDGYGVRAADAPGRLRVVGGVAAGATATPTVGPGEAVRIFTGAPIPPGVDAVVMQERVEAADGFVTVTEATPAGQFILARGAETRAGDTVLPAGGVLSPTAFGVLAAVGRTTVRAYPRPVVSILATGDELVEANMRPGPGQLRNTNGPMLAAQVVRAGGLPRYLGIARDDAATLSTYLREGLTTSQILVVAGGVSVGDHDLVPRTLAGLGVEVRFRQVRMKPGKPILMGTRGDVLVFGLPGNPVSALVGFELFVRPALRVLAGHAEPGPTVERLPLAADFAAGNHRPTYHPARVVGRAVEPLPWLGSPDLRGVLAADAFVVLPAGEVHYAAGAPVEVMRVD